MSVPTVYDEETLVLYMEDTLGAAAVRQLDWSVASDYDEAVSETMLAMGTDDLATVTGLANIRLLRATARRELWRLVASRTAHLVDATTEGGGEDHSQLHEHARRMAEQAAAEVVEYQVLADAAASTELARPTIFAVASGRRWRP